MNNELKIKIDNDLLNTYKNGPKSLLEIYKYVFSAKGKRIRPILTLLTSKSLYGEYNKSYQAAIAIEMLHNFTLIHDDIMDNDDLRHGNVTIHKKWNNSIIKLQNISESFLIRCPSIKNKIIMQNMIMHK